MIDSRWLPDFSLELGHSSHALYYLLVFTLAVLYGLCFYSVY